MATLDVADRVERHQRRLIRKTDWDLPEPIAKIEVLLESTRKGVEVAVAIPFDTLDYARKLESAGVPATQAELQASALGEALAKAVAGPSDLVALESRLGARIDALEARFVARSDAVEARFDAVEGRIETSKNELRLELGGRIDRLAASVDNMKWMFGFVAALNIAILARTLLIR